MIFTQMRKVKWVLLVGDFPVPTPNKQLQEKRSTGYWSELEDDIILQEVLLFLCKV